MVNVETLKILENGERMLVMTDCGQLCILKLSSPVPPGYQIKTVQLPENCQVGISEATQEEGMFVPVVSVQLQISQKTPETYCTNSATFYQ